MKIFSGRYHPWDRKISAIILALILSCWVSGIAAAAEVDIPCAKEPKDTLIDYGNTVVTCSLENLVDTDAFRWDGKKGEQVVIRTRAVDSFLEPCISLYDPDKKLIKESRCGLNEVVQKVDATLKRNGTFTVSVSDRDRDETGGYNLILERIIPPSPSAKTIAGFGLEEEDLIDLLGDIDFFLFRATGDETVEIVARALGSDNFLEPCLTLYDPTGVVLGRSSCRLNEVVQVINQGVAGAGIHIIRVDDRNSDETGDYQLVVQCLFGTCDILPEALDYLDIASLASFSGNRRAEIASLRLERNALPSNKIRERSRVIVEDGRTGDVIRTITFFGDDWRPKALVSLPDMPTSANGVGELVVLAVSDSGTAKFRIKDARDAETLATITVFDARWDIRNMATAPDETKDGVPEIAVLAVNRSTGKVVVRIFDPLGGVQLRQLSFPSD